MPQYTFLCRACKKEFSKILTLSDHEKGGIVCSHCKSKDVEHAHPCPQQAVSRCSNRDVQDPCGFRCAEILDVLKEEHFPIFRRQSFNRTPQRVTQFFPPKRLPGDIAPVRQVFCNLAGTERSLGGNRSEDLFKTACRNRKCFCAHTY